MAKPTNKAMILAMASDPAATWADRIPVDSQTDFEKFGVTLLSEEYQAEYNVFLDQLINKIAMTWIKSATLTNRLAFLRNGEFNLGDVIEEIFVGLVKSYTFDPAIPPAPYPDQFEKFIPNVNSMFHRRDRKMYYPITIQYEDMRAAFRNPTGLSGVVERVVGSLYQTNTLDSYIFQKEQFVQYRYLHPAGLPLQSTQFIPTPRPVDNATGAEFYKTVKSAVRKMGFPSNAYNAAQQTLQSGEDGFYMFLLSDIAPSLEVDTLARTFNMGQLTSRTTPVITELDSFGDPLSTGENNDDVLAVLMDKRAIGVLNNLFTLRTADNARGLYRNYFLHVWDLHYCSYYQNLVYIVDSALYPPTP